MPPDAAPTDFPLTPGTFAPAGRIAAPAQQHANVPQLEVPDITAEQDLVLAGGGARVHALELHVIRPLAPEDIASLVREPGHATQHTEAQSTLAIRTTHHQVAQLLAQDAPGAEIQLITGYSAARISMLRKDPAFQELVAYYQTGAEQVMQDALEQLRSTGLVANEVLRERLLDQPGQFAPRELVEIIKATITDPTANAKRIGGFGAGNGGTSIAISFVSPPAQGQVIEMQAEEIG